MRQVRHPDKKNIDSELLAALDRLGGIVGEILRDWQKRVREEIDVRKRRQFQGYLRYMGALFIPPTQGKRAGRIGVPDSEVWKRYYSNLFRCEQAKVLLKTLAHCPGCRRWQVRLQAVCERFAIPQDPKWWGFKEEAQVLRQLLFSKETAVLLTARHFSPIAEQTIRNILAR